MAKILVVDDEADTLHLVKMVLEEEGHSITTAENGAMALLSIAEIKPDAIIMDIVMPIMDGFQTMHVLKSSPENEAIPIIMLTGRAASQDVMKGWEEGAAFYLTKPFAVEELLSAVRRILAQANPHS
jgi:twitching motility two-component system response regulator PilH